MQVHLYLIKTLKLQFKLIGHLINHTDLDILVERCSTYVNRKKKNSNLIIKCPKVWAVFFVWSKKENENLKFFSVHSFPSIDRRSYFLKLSITVQQHPHSCKCSHWDKHLNLFVKETKIITKNSTEKVKSIFEHFKWRRWSFFFFQILCW